jgi:copper(I)-binding protein
MSACRPLHVRPPSARALLLMAVLLVGSGVHAHGAMAGDVLVDHPYAIPAAPGDRLASVYFRTLKNTGLVADRLLGARTPVAQTVEIQRSTPVGGVAGRRTVAALDIPAGAELRLRHGGDTHLVLGGLGGPLRDGDRFSLTLRFERGGEREVTVWVQQPRDRAAPTTH